MSGGNSNHIACLGDVAIQKYDIDTISNPYSWVNDAIIHIFGRMIERNTNKSETNQNNKILFVAPCTVQFIRFFQIEDDVKDCVQKLKIQNFRAVFFPLTNGTSFTSRGNHWSLLIFLTSENKFLFCDSIYKNRNASIAELLIRKIELFLNLQAELIEMNLPSQTNSYDCGVFIMAYMEYFAQHGNFDDIEKHVNQKRVREFRQIYTQQIQNIGI